MPAYNSAINTASLGTGFVYSDGSGLLGIGAAPGGLNILVTKFNASGTFTKNISTKFIDVICWNGGGGGGSGRQGASGAAGGGSGGAGGGVLVFSGMASNFNASESVTIGSGGAGGNAQASANTDGNDGTPGGVSALGNIFISLAGSGTSYFNNGKKGINGSVYGGSQGSYIYPYYPLKADHINQAGTGALGGGGNAETVTDGSSTATTFALYYIPQSGGGGAGANTISGYSGGNGGDSIAFLTQVGLAVPDVLNAGGSGGIESGTIDGGNGNDAITTGGGRYVPASGGGAGGGQSSGLVAGNGGNGGIPGAGAGGGAGSLNGTNSGTGGDGGRGEVWVIEYY